MADLRAKGDKQTSLWKQTIGNLHQDCYTALIYTDNMYKCRNCRKPLLEIEVIMLDFKLFSAFSHGLKKSCYIYVYVY